jgi:hypothetical protein
MKTHLLAGLLAVLAASAQAVSFEPSLQMDVRAGHVSQPSPAMDDFAWAGQLYAIPALQLSDRSSLVPLFAYMRTDSDAVVEEDSFFVEDDIFLARPLYSYTLNDSWDLKAWGDARRAVTLESYQAQWSEGIYDYEEFGGGVGATWKHAGANLSTVDMGLELLHRGYPNWHELVAISGVTQTGTVVGGQNYYDKDYVGYKATLAFNSPSQGRWTWTANLTYEDEDYTDALVETNQGFQVGDSLRRDHYGYVDANLTRIQGAWLAALTLDLAGDLSNGNVLDSGHAQYIPGYYDYLSEQLGLSVTRAWDAGKGPSLTLQASLLNRDYSGPGDGGRLIQNPDLSYTKGKEEDVEQRYHIDGRWPLMWKLALVANVDYTVALSNQTTLGAYHPTYTLLQAMAGLQYKL